MSASKPVRVAVIGLSASSKMAWAVRAHLPYFKTTDKFKIVALLNSSEEAGREAVKAFDLPPTTKGDDVI